MKARLVSVNWVKTYILTIRETNLGFFSDRNLSLLWSLQSSQSFATMLCWMQSGIHEHLILILICATSPNYFRFCCQTKPMKHLLNFMTSSFDPFTTTVISDTQYTIQYMYTQIQMAALTGIIAFAAPLFFLLFFGGWGGGCLNHWNYISFISLFTKTQIDFYVSFLSFLENKRANISDPNSGKP